MTFFRYCLIGTGRAFSAFRLLMQVKEYMSPCYLLHGLVSFFVIANNVSRSAWVSRTLYCFPLIVFSPPNESIGFYSRHFSKIGLLDRQCEKDKVLHIIADNYKTHNSKLLHGYMAGHPGRFVLHFTPTHASWLNIVERFFREITTERIRRESWNSINELVAAIKAYIKNWNKSGRTFQWSKTSGEIIRKIKKHKMLNS